MPTYLPATKFIITPVHAAVGFYIHSHSSYFVVHNEINKPLGQLPLLKTKQGHPSSLNNYRLYYAQLYHVLNVRALGRNIAFTACHEDMIMLYGILLF